MLTNIDSSRLPLQLPWPFAAIVYLRRLALFFLAAAIPLLAFPFLGPRRVPGPIVAIVTSSLLIGLSLEYVAWLLCAREIRKTLQSLRKTRRTCSDQLRGTPAGPEMARRIDESLARIEKDQSELEDILTIPFGLLRKGHIMLTAIIDARQQAEMNSSPLVRGAMTPS
jgi:hypothetical protein